jgi:hypothetical protein
MIRTNSNLFNLICIFPITFKLYAQHRSARSRVSSNIKEAVFAVYGESMLDRINTKATPQAIAAWKSSEKTKNAYNKLFRPVNPDNSGETYFDRIVARAWPSTTPTYIQMAFTVTVCQILLRKHYEKLTMSDQITQNRLNKNIVSNI